MLEIHIDKNAVANMQLSIILRGEVPIKSIILNAILRCKPDVSTPMAKINPPKNIIVALFRYCIATVFWKTYEIKWFCKWKNLAFLDYYYTY